MDALKLDNSKLRICALELDRSAFSIVKLDHSTLRTCARGHHVLVTFSALTIYVSIFHGMVEIAIVLNVLGFHQAHVCLERSHHRSNVQWKVFQSTPLCLVVSCAIIIYGTHNL